jgi:hypothetical protein
MRQRKTRVPLGEHGETVRTLTAEGRSYTEISRRTGVNAEIILEEWTSAGGKEAFAKNGPAPRKERVVHERVTPEIPDEELRKLAQFARNGAAEWAVTSFVKETGRSRAAVIRFLELRYKMLPSFDKNRKVTVLITRLVEEFARKRSAQAPPP